MSDTNNEQTLDPDTLASLFEPVDETEKQAGADNNDSIKELSDLYPDGFVPEPTNSISDDKENAEEITSDTIPKGILTLNDEGHSDSVIVASLERLHNVQDGAVIEELSEDDREQIDGMTIEGAAVDIYTLDGHLFNLILKFDTVKDAYLQELHDILNRYRVMQESMAANDSVPETEAAMFSISLMPESLNGFGALTLTFPAAYFRILDDNGVNASMLIQFYEENLQFQTLDIDEDMQSELTADVMREFEEGEGGQIFDTGSGMY